MRKVTRYAMIGGGEGAFIGAIHRLAARMSGDIELVAGAFSRKAENNVPTGYKLGIEPSRIYGDYQSLLASEAAKPESERPHFIAIVTPNDSHAPIAIAAMQAGFDVLSDKPMADTLVAAQSMCEAAKATGRRLGITHTYAGYPMVKQARRLMTAQDAGALRRVTVSYSQDWLSKASDTSSSAQAAWRTDPKRSGDGGAMGDIGTHAFHLAEFITGQKVASLCADVRNAVEGRLLDDDGACLLRFEGGARGTLMASQVCTGDINALKISAYADNLAIHWHQEDPNRLRVCRRDAPEEIWTSGSNRAYLEGDISSLVRAPAGHPEGYLEAFANIYEAFAADIQDGGRARENSGYAGPDESLRTLQFVKAVVSSSRDGAIWKEV